LKTGTPQIIRRLDPLIRRLASGFDGERLECVRAMERTLQSGGASFHDLADALAKVPTPPAEPETHEDEMLSALKDWPTLNLWERSFVASLQQWRTMGRTLTPKQRATLRRVFAERVLRR
jgi:hypothetical protein